MVDDLISRQAAWEITAKLHSEFITIEQEEILERIDEMIEQLPSAQHEKTFEFGKWYDFERGYVLETTDHSFRILKDVESSSNE